MLARGRKLRSDAVSRSTLMSALGRTGRWRQVLDLTRGGRDGGDDGSRLVLKHGLEMGWRWRQTWRQILVQVGFMMTDLCAETLKKKCWDGN